MWVARGARRHARGTTVGGGGGAGGAEEEVAGKIAPLSAHFVPAGVAARHNEIAVLMHHRRNDAGTQIRDGFVGWMFWEVELTGYRNLLRAKRWDRPRKYGL